MASVGIFRAGTRWPKTPVVPVCDDSRKPPLRCFLKSSLLEVGPAPSVERNIQKGEAVACPPKMYCCSPLCAFLETPRKLILLLPAMVAQLQGTSEHRTRDCQVALHHDPSLV